MRESERNGQAEHPIVQQHEAPTDTPGQPLEPKLAAAGVVHERFEPSLARPLNQRAVGRDVPANGRLTLPRVLVKQRFIGCQLVGGRAPREREFRQGRGSLNMTLVSWRSRRVSVVFPTYNERDSIQAAILDFLATEVVDEIVVVNNNAAAGTSEEVAKAAEQSPPGSVVEVLETKQGYGNAIQRGLKDATGVGSGAACLGKVALRCARPLHNERIGGGRLFQRRQLFFVLFAAFD